MVIFYFTSLGRGVPERPSTTRSVGESWEMSGIAPFLQEELSLGATVVLSFHWGVPTFSSCLWVFKSQRIPDWFGVGGP